MKTKRTILICAIAACILLILGIGVFFVASQQPSNDDSNNTNEFAFNNNANRLSNNNNNNGNNNVNPPNNTANNTSGNVVENTTNINNNDEYDYEEDESYTIGDGYIINDKTGEKINTRPNSFSEENIATNTPEHANDILTRWFTGEGLRPGDFAENYDEDDKSNQVYTMSHSLVPPFKTRDFKILSTDIVSRAESSTKFKTQYSVVTLGQQSPYDSAAYIPDTIGTYEATIVCNAIGEITYFSTRTITEQTL